MAAATAAVIGGAAVLGGVAGSMKKKSTSSSQQQSFLELDPMSNSELNARDKRDTTFSDAFYGVQAGPGQQDIQAGVQADRGFASLLEQVLANGGMPSEADFQNADKFTQSAFAPERQALDSTFQDLNQETARLTAQLGRAGDDPILQAKLAQEKSRQSGALSARETQFRSQFAQQQPYQQISLAQQLSQVRGGLASQALNNRLTLAQLGSGILDQERNFRLQTANRVTLGSGKNEGGGGTAGAISGGLAGAGTGASLVGAFGGNPGVSSPVAAGAGGGGSFMPAIGQTSGFLG